MPDARSKPAHIGVFDSGIGGLSVLKALLARRLESRLHYVADSAHAPYGERPAQEIVALSMRVCEYLIHEGARLVVVACNTATAAAIAALRARWPTVDFVGIEPAIKPAALLTRNGRIGVMATPATLESERFRHLVQRHAAGAEVVLQACPGLAAAIERHAPHDTQLHLLVQRFAAPLGDAGVDTVVLGCTHYPLVRPVLQACLGNSVTLVDPAEAVAARAHALWRVEDEDSGLRMSTTGRIEALTREAHRWLGMPVEVRAVP